MKLKDGKRDKSDSERKAESWKVEIQKAESQKAESVRSVDDLE